MMNQESPIWIDTDNAMGSGSGDIDDAIAISALFAANRNILGVTPERPTWRFFDFNVWKDPISTQYVFTQGLPITVSPCNVAQNVRISRQDLQVIPGIYFLPPIRTQSSLLLDFSGRLCSLRRIF